MSTIPEQNRRRPDCYAAWMDLVRQATDVLPNYPLLEDTRHGVPAPMLYRDLPESGTLTVRISPDTDGAVVRARESWRFTAVTRSYFISGQENPITDEDYTIALAETRMPLSTLGAVVLRPSGRRRLLAQAEVIEPYRPAGPHEYLELHELLQNTADKLQQDINGECRFL